MLENLIGLSILATVLFVFMWALGKAWESDLEDLEKSNPKFRKFLKDKYKI